MKYFYRLCSILFFLCLLINVSSLLPEAAAQNVDFPDANLREKVRRALNADGIINANLSPTDPIPQSTLRRLKSLTITDGTVISDLTGLEHATVLHVLALQNTQEVTDLTPISGISLGSFFLTNNQVEDITPLQGSRTSLEFLGLSGNRISDISILSTFTNLIRLDLHNNQIRDISPLSGKSRLTKLHLQNNQITDATLSGLKVLTELHLQNNQIRTVNLSGLTSLDKLYLQNNQITNLSGLSGLTSLDNLYLQNNRLTDISGLSGLGNLDKLYLQNNRISNLSPLSSLFSLDELNLCYNEVVDISTLANLTQLRQLWIESGFATNFTDVIATIEGRGTTITFCSPQATRSNQSTSFSIPENIAIGENIGTPFSTTELGEGSLTYTLEGSDAAFFSIDAETGQLRTATESYLKDLYTLTVVISNVRADITRIPITITIIRAPVEQIHVPPPSSPIHQDRIVFNEIRNAEDDVNDWLELKNISEEPVSLKDWEISIVTHSPIKQVNTPEAAGKDEDIVAFPDYTLPAGGVLLILNTDPSETQLVSGQDITDAEHDLDAYPQYLIASEMRLSDTPYLLILRSARDQNATPESVEDTAGNYFRGSVYYSTQIWPLRGAVQPDEEEDAAKLTPGQAWQRISVEALGYTRVAWGLSGYQSGLGYKPTTPIAMSLGTPGYPNDHVADTELLGRITVSEIMYTTEGGLLSQAQWIELYNNTPHADVPLNLKGWQLTIEARDSNGRHRYSTIKLETLDIASGETVLLVSRDRPKSEHISGAEVYELDRHETDAGKLDWRENRIIGSHGFGLRLYSPDGTLVDIAGNLDGKRGKDTPKWELPSGRTEDGARTSLIRQYEDNRALGGNEAATWTRAADLNLPAKGYYGDKTDISTAGYSDSIPDPVETPDYSVGVGGITVSEVMVASDTGRFSAQAQWIELYNNTPDTQASVNLEGWQLIIEARDPNGRHRYSALELKAMAIASGETVLLVSQNRPKSDHISDAQLYELSKHNGDAPKLGQHENQVLGHHGFGLRLYSPDGTLVDIVGNLDGKRGKDTPTWELPSGRLETGTRTSLIRRFEDKVPLDGTVRAGWIRAANTALSVNGYYGQKTDLGTPGYWGSSSLPVTLSHFRAARTESGVIVAWTTSLELNNAGFNILRSQARKGAYVKVNATLIVGAGTTAEANTYTWTDKTAKPNTAYYYKIEDVSLDGTRQRSISVRMRGHLSASGKSLQTWADLKKQE